MDNEMSMESELTCKLNLTTDAQRLLVKVIQGVVDVIGTIRLLATGDM